jgi:hypothetical protein
VHNGTGNGGVAILADNKNRGKPMKHPLLRFFSLLVFSLPVLVRADATLDTLAREVDRVESIRATKILQHSYAQYAQSGLWNAVGALFTDNGRFIFDGLIMPAQTAVGPVAIAEFLRTRYGGGMEGQTATSLSTMFIESPIINLAVDGENARGRWQVMIFHGQGNAARIEGGVMNVDYVRDAGIWKIATLQYYPQYDGPYEEGWTNWGGGDIPVAPRHYTPEIAGVPVPPATGPAPVTTTTLPELQARVDTLNEIDRVLNLQSAYGYYYDRKMWNDVVDLFADDAIAEIGGIGLFRGRNSIDRWLRTEVGAAGLAHGQLNDQGQNNVIVTLAPGGNEAFARGIELGMLGEADQEQGWWEVTIFRNRFVKEDGVWKIRELRRFPLMKTDIFLGWGQSRLENRGEANTRLADSLPPAEDSVPPGLAMPAFLGSHPVTGEPVTVAGDLQLVATQNLLGEIPAGTAAPVAVAEVQRRLARSAAYDGIANISAAYGYYIDDSNALGWASTLAADGFKETPFAGYHIGRERLIQARVRGPGPETQRGISYHWTVQPVVYVSDDGRSATGRFRLFQPRTGQTVGGAGDFFAASFWGGMYHNRYVLEEGIWRIWELTLDEPYITPVGWKDGVWAKAKDPETPPRRGGGSTDVDVSLKDLVVREANLPGGPGETWEWPTILPMWFSYLNPVSGREPEHYQPDCVPCMIRPDLRLEANGYQEPPNGPDANRSPNR